MKLTITDIAKKTGMSKSTVSRVLTNNPNVNIDTRLKVQKIIDENKYQPNSLARGLSTGRLNIIALIIEDIRNPFYSELTWIIENEFSKNGFMVVLFNTDYNLKKELLYLKTAKHYGFASIILMSAMENDSLASIIKSMNCPVLMLNRYINSFEGDTLITDNFQGGYLATRHLIELGHTKIGMLTGSLDSSTHKERHAGYVNALKAFNIEYNDRYVSSGKLTIQGGYEYGLSILEMGDDRPTAVFTSNDLMAIGVIEAFKKKEMSIPKELSVIGFDDIPIASISSINLTTIRQSYSEIANNVVKLTLDRINNKSEQAKKFIFSPKLIVRGTTRQI
ncbi:MAG TPA: LacI family transcriptional regulator [Firmicutes bacterium]|jgi:LacI family transcriptional regulator|nr:LacI family transcriptional regulator [Bacillota bacterium]